MYRRAIQLSLVLSLVAWPAMVSARAPQAAATTTPATTTPAPAPATPPKKIVIVKVIQPKPAAPAPAAAATPAPAVAKPATTAAPAATTPKAATSTTAATSTAAAPKAANGNSAASILSTIFGTGGSGSSTAGAATSAATTAAGSTKAGATAASAAGTASSTKSAVSGNSASGILTSIFGSGGVVPGATGKGGAGAGGAGGKAGGAPAAADGANALVATTPDAARGRAPIPSSPAAAAGAERTSASGSGLPNGALGVAQFSDTILTVYGCTRQGTQVLCDADLSNQSKTETQVQSSVLWKDAFIIDDRGDRHQRSSGFFVNVDGDQRQAMDIPYGQSARYIFVFNDVSPKVQQVTLKSATGGLNVENIAVAGVSVTPNQGGADQASGGAGQHGQAGHSQAGAPSTVGAAAPNL
jgi:hypothetical protein